MLKLDSRPAKTKDIPWKMIEQEAVLVDMEEGEVIRLNEIGAWIWQAIDGNNSVEDIIHRVDEAFEASEGENQAEAKNKVESVEQSLARLTVSGKIRVANLGNAVQRAVLIRDANKLVVLAVIKLHRDSKVRSAL